MMSNWFERYQEQINHFEPDEFVEELKVAAEEFLVQLFRHEMEHPDNFPGAQA